jgi:DNA-directed RNA polymerase subunit beta'
MGRLIPAGTGLAAYKSLNVIVEGEGRAEDRYIPSSLRSGSASLSAVNE